MRGDAAESNGGVGGELTTRCRLERCVSGMKRTGRVTWSSRVWKKVNSLPMELLTTDLLAAKNTVEKVESEQSHVRKSGSRGRRPSPPAHRLCRSSPSSCSSSSPRRASSSRHPEDERPHGYDENVRRVSHVSHVCVFVCSFLLT